MAATTSSLCTEGAGLLRPDQHQGASAEATYDQKPGTVNNKTSSTPANLEQDRLLSLIEFAKQSAKLRSTPASTVTQHKLLTLYEHDIQGRPGIDVNLNREIGRAHV